MDCQKCLKMIDFVKLNVQNPDLFSIKQLPSLDWEQRMNETTGEVKEQSATFNGLSLVIKVSRYLYISGSLHKYWNITKIGEDQNYNDFTFSSLCWTIEDIASRFNLNPTDCKIENIEFGVNIQPTIPTNDILMSVINHKGKPFTQEYGVNKYFRECEHQRYYLKIYDKGLQYHRPDNILRFENKTIRMEHLKGTGIESLADLLEKGKILSLGVFLEGDLSDLLFYDYSIRGKNLNASERLILSNGQSPTYWTILKKSNPENYYKKRKRFRELVKQHGKQDIQETINKLLANKWVELLQSAQETTGINPIPEGLKTVNFTDSGKIKKSLLTIKS